MRAPSRSSRPPELPLVTFDLFSALIDSRTGASRVLEDLAAARGWPVGGEQVYDEWDRRNKESQRIETVWRPFVEHCRSAMEATYVSIRLEGDAPADADLLLGTVGRWPLWPDVLDGFEQVRTRVRIGVLSNVDDAVYARTAVARLGIALEDVLTSERLRAYKPAARLYRRAVEELPALRLHVASSARDVRGALEAGIPTVRLIRPGHVLDAEGPAPAVQIRRIAELLASEGMLAGPP